MTAYRLIDYCSRWLSPAGLDLAERLLSYDPAQRVTAVDALEAPYFRQEHPPAALPVGYVVKMHFILFVRCSRKQCRLSTLEGEWHELETKRERAKKRRKTEPTMP
jgi:CTD kinase subunit alpha